MSSLSTQNVDKSHILARKCFIFLKKRPRPNLKVFQYHIWTAVKSLEK